MRRDPPANNQTNNPARRPCYRTLCVRRSFEAQPADPNSCDGWARMSRTIVGRSDIRCGFVESAEVRGAGRPVVADGIVVGADLMCSQHAHPLCGHRLGPGTPQRQLCRNARRNDNCVATRAEMLQRRGNVPQPTKQRLFAGQSLAIVGDGEINGTPSLGSVVRVSRVTKYRAPAKHLVAATVRPCGFSSGATGKGAKSDSNPKSARLQTPARENDRRGWRRERVARYGLGTH